MNTQVILFEELDHVLELMKKSLIKTKRKNMKNVHVELPFQANLGNSPGQSAIAVAFTETKCIF